MSPTNRKIIKLLVTAGFSARGVQTMLRKGDGTRYSVWTIYAEMSRQSISARAFRNGESHQAKEMIRLLLRTKPIAGIALVKPRYLVA